LSLLVAFACCFMAKIACAGETSPHSRADVESAYRQLATLDLPDRHTAVRGVPELKNELWVVHLEQFRASHPELTDEQRSVVLESLAFLREGGRTSDPRTLKGSFVFWSSAWPLPSRRNSAAKRSLKWDPIRFRSFQCLGFTLFRESWGSPRPPLVLALKLTPWATVIAARLATFSRPVMNCQRIQEVA
jgi:hypothetical protein